MLFSGTALATITPCDVRAQQAGSRTSRSAEGENAIIVTGQRIGAGQSRASAVLTADDIAERPLGADITQSLVKIPGVQISTGDARGGSFSFELYLRGLNKEQVGLTIDGIPTGDARFNGGSPPQRFIDSSNIGKISVSQSAGDIGAPSRFALGGFIDFATDDPASKPSGAFESGYGSYDFYRQYFRVDSGEIWRGFTAYGSFSHQQNDVWAARASRSSYRDHAEAKFVQKFDTGSFIKGRFSYNDQRDNDFNIITQPEFLANRRSDRATDALTGIPSVDVDFGGALGGTRKDLLAYINGRLQLGDHVQININPYYQTLRGESNRLQDRSRQLAGANPYAVTGYNATGGAVRPALATTPASVRNVVGGPEDLRITPRDRDRYGITGELRLDNVIANNIIRLGGWYEGSSSTEERRFYKLINPVSGLAYDRSTINYVEYARSADIDVTMLYAQDQIEVIPDLLRVDAGVTWMNVRYEAQSPLEYSAVVKFSQHSPINPKIGISLTPARHVELFGGYAKNFAGIPEDAFLGSTAVIAPADLSPIQTENFDIGARYTARNFAFSVQGFRVHLKNNIGIVPRDPTNTDVDEIVRGNVATRAANILGVTTKGIEVTGLADFGIVNLYGAYSYQDAKHDDPAIGSADRRNLASVAVIGGAAVRDIPKHSFYGQIGVKPFEGATINLTGRYVGSRVGGHIVAPASFAEIGVERLPSYEVFGLNASYRVRPFGPFGELLFQFNVDNMFDEKYIGAVSSSTATQPEFGYSAATPANRTLDRYFIGAPRTYTISMRAKF